MPLYNPGIFILALIHALALGLLVESSIPDRPDQQIFSGWLLKVDA
jgi:hypothetical protein